MINITIMFILKRVYGKADLGNFWLFDNWMSSFVGGPGTPSEVYRPIRLPQVWKRPQAAELWGWACKAGRRRARLQQGHERDREYGGLSMHSPRTPQVTTQRAGLTQEWFLVWGDLLFPKFSILVFKNEEI